MTLNISYLKSPRMILLCLVHCCILVVTPIAKPLLSRQLLQQLLQPQSTAQHGLCSLPTAPTADNSSPLPSPSHPDSSRGHSQDDMESHGMKRLFFSSINYSQNKHDRQRNRDKNDIVVCLIDSRTALKTICNVTTAYYDGASSPGKACVLWRLGLLHVICILIAYLSIKEFIL